MFLLLRTLELGPLFRPPSWRGQGRFLLEAPRRGACSCLLSASGCRAFLGSRPALRSHSHPSTSARAPSPAGLTSPPPTRLPSTYKDPDDGTGPTTNTRPSLSPGPCLRHQAEAHVRGRRRSQASLEPVSPAPTRRSCCSGAPHCSSVGAWGSSAVGTDTPLHCGGNGGPEQWREPRRARKGQCSDAPCRSPSPTSFLEIPPPRALCPQWGPRSVASSWLLRCDSPLKSLQGNRTCRAHGSLRSGCFERCLVWLHCFLADSVWGFRKD